MSVCKISVCSKCPAIIPVIFTVTFVCASPAHAVYTGLSVELYTTVSINGVGRNVFRVYANFTGPNDQLVGVSADPNGSLLHLQSRLYDGGGPGSNFYNHPFGGITAPTQEAIDAAPDAQWDTFGTIGVSIADQAPYQDWTSLLLNTFPITGHDYNGIGGWGTPVEILPPGGSHTIVNPQSLAGFAGDGDLALRVLAFQLTVNSNSYVRGTVRVSGPFLNHYVNQTFDAAPAPGTLSVLAFGLVAARRRRG